MIKEKCNAVDCNKERYGLKEYCRKHYLQIKNHGRLTPELEVNPIIQDSICSIDGCDKNVYSKNLCKYHYNKQRFENLELKNELGTYNISSCKVEGCDDIILAKGYCIRHYHQYLKHGEITLIEKRIKYPTICKVNSCNEKSYGNGYCRSHYHKWYNHGNPLYVNEVKIKQCSIKGCDGKYYAKGYCRNHYIKYARIPKDKQENINN